LNVSSVHWQALFVHVRPLAQVPHDPPQPSDPQVFPEHDGTQAHVPDALQLVPVAQLPHDPPQPSDPHSFPEQDRTQLPLLLPVLAPLLEPLLPEELLPEVVPALLPEVLPAVPELLPEVPVPVPHGEAQLLFSQDTRFSSGVTPDGLLFAQS
jgi:hypothetical protein